MPDIKAAVREHQNKVRELLDAYPDLAWDETALADTVEGLVDTDRIIAAVIDEALTREALAAGINARIKTLIERRERLALGAGKMRELALQAMEECNIPKITAPGFTASLSMGKPAVVITDENLLPRRFTVTVYKPDKKEISAALKDGEEVPGAELSNVRQTLTVRTA